MPSMRMVRVIREGQFMWLSTKQPVVALSTCESELIATCTFGCAVEWARQFVQELGYAQGTIEIGVDNKCSMRLLEQGTGSFKRAKHIKVRLRSSAGA